MQQLCSSPAVPSGLAGQMQRNRSRIGTIRRSGPDGDDGWRLNRSGPVSGRPRVVVSGCFFRLLLLLLLYAARWMVVVRPSADPRLGDRSRLRKWVWRGLGAGSVVSARAEQRAKGGQNTAASATGRRRKKRRRVSSSNGWLAGFATMWFVDRERWELGRVVIW